ncbi:mandelate racemase/muconate lactonizing enzyme family protein [Rhodoferax sp.]|uniref:mandelate racemase/muconate lactonizing enzyme family protein n=1 Tax=Rhodoferax sp. TaxID=50421 RepID=UPI0025D3DDAA|nr:mandelate racemase/muconate lactonizing enzyme family protein [Rhodoferax sp.]
MQLESIQTFVVANPPPSFGGRYFVFVKLRTRCGIEGIGEAYTATFGPQVVAAMAEDLFARVFQGEDPMQTETLWRRAYGEGFSLRPDISLMGVLSALEMACWDITGKALEQPVYKLLGGLVNPRLRSYTYLYPDPGEDESFYGDPDRSAARAVRYVEEGFTAVKFDPVGGYSVFDPRQPTLERMDMSERFCARIREAVGDKADLLFGTHGQFTVSGAKRLARRLERYDPLWFEEPTPPERPEAMAEVARYTCIPVATGERLCTKYEFARVLETGAASILQPNLGRVGGILEAKKIAGMAEAHYAQIAPHLYCGPVVAAANIQLAACIPNFLILESIQQFGGFHAQLLKKPLQWEGGYVIPSKEPGLGVELNEAVALAHPYDSTRLHLDMAQHPLGYY